MTTPKITISDQNVITRGELARVLTHLSACFWDGADPHDISDAIDELAADVSSGETIPETREELLVHKVDVLSEVAALANEVTLWRHGYKVVNGAVVELDGDEGEHEDSPPEELLRANEEARHARDLE